MLSASRLQRAVAGRLGLQTLAARWKTTTGIVGLPVDEEARPHLEEHYELVLDTIKVIPETAVYRQTVEKTVQKRLAALRTDASDEELEQQFGRQLEEEIRVMQGELRLIPKMAEWKPWDVPADYTIPVMEEQDLREQLDGDKPAPPK